MTIRDSVSIDAANGSTVAAASYSGVSGDNVVYSFSSAATAVVDRARHFNTMLLDVLHLERVPSGERPAIVAEIASAHPRLDEARGRFIAASPGVGVDVPVPAQIA